MADRMTKEEIIAAMRASGQLWNWSQPKLYSHDYCRSAPEAGLDNEDLRLYRRGLDPEEMNSLEIMVELDKRMAENRARR
ncbi:MAG: hypothetical protein ABSG16_24505 [Candidatus Acidiferrum sp.]